MVMPIVAIPPSIEAGLAPYRGHLRNSAILRLPVSGHCAVMSTRHAQWYYLSVIRYGEMIILRGSPPQRRPA